MRFVLPHLKAWRSRAVMSQKQLAKLAGVTPGTIIRLERGEAANATTIHKLAQGLGISVQQLIHEGPEDKIRGAAA